MRLYKHDVRAFALAYPYCLSRLYACLLGKLILCQNYAVSYFWISANGKRQPVIFGMQLLFYGCVEIIEVAMKNCSVHTFIITVKLLQNKQ